MLGQQLLSAHSSNFTNTGIQALEHKANDLESTAQWMLKEVASLRQEITTLKQQSNQTPTSLSKSLGMWDVSVKSLESQGLCKTSNQAVNDQGIYQAPQDIVFNPSDLNALANIDKEHLSEPESGHLQCQDTSYTDLDISSRMFRPVSDSLSCTTKLLPPFSSFTPDINTVSINSKNVQNAQQIPAFNKAGTWMSPQGLATIESYTIRDNRADNHVTTTQVVLPNLPALKEGGEDLYHTQNDSKPIEIIVKRKRGRPRTSDLAHFSQSQFNPQQRTKIKHVLSLNRSVPIRNEKMPLFKFLINQLDDQKNYDLVWTDKANGCFKIKNTKSVAQKWGGYKNNETMTWEKLARSLRYYEKSCLLINKPGQRLSFQFNNHHPYMKN